MWVILCLFSTTRVSDPGRCSQTPKRKTICIPRASLNEELSLAKRSARLVDQGLGQLERANFRSDRDITIYGGTPGETCPGGKAGTDGMFPVSGDDEDKVNLPSVPMFPRFGAATEPWHLP